MKNIKNNIKNGKVGNIEIRRASKEDVNRIWEIRNHPIVRENSGNTEVIPLENHLKWFNKKYFEGGGNFCYVLKEKNKSVGYCRFDFDENKNIYVVSIALDPGNHGKGLGSQLLVRSIGKLEDELKASAVLFAEVQKNNIPSVKLFEKNGFLKNAEDENNFYFIKKINEK